jgi:hypothetical protein
MLQATMASARQPAQTHAKQRIERMPDVLPLAHYTQGSANMYPAHTTVVAIPCVTR